MSSIENEILDEFLTALKNENVSSRIVDSLEELLRGDKRLKPEEIAAAFVLNSTVGEE
jgi:hypothetical protein